MSLSAIPKGLTQGLSSEWSIDTVKLHFTLPEDKILSEYLKANVILIDEYDPETGDIYKADIKRDPKRHEVGEDPHVIRRYVYAKDKRGNQGVVLYLKSKSLNELYLHGISEKTLDRVLDIIKQDSVIDITREDLLNARFTDMDIKRDFVIGGDPADLKDAYKWYKSMVSLYVPSSQKGRSIRLHPKTFKLETTNVGLEINERSYHKTVIRTFYKSYYKGGYLLFDEKERKFYDKYLSLYLTQDFVRQLHRQEYQVSNRSHAHSLGISLDPYGHDTFGDIISLLSDYQSVFTVAKEKVFQSNFVSLPKPMDKSTSKYNAQDYVIRALIIKVDWEISDSNQKGLTVIPEVMNILNYSIGQDKDRKFKSRLRQRVISVYEDLLLSGALKSVKMNNRSVSQERTSNVVFQKMSEIHSF